MSYLKIIKRKSKRFLFTELIFVLIGFSLIACKKSNGSSSKAKGGYGYSGSIIFAFEGIKKIDLQTRALSKLQPLNANRYAWDVGSNGNLLVQEVMVNSIKSFKFELTNSKTGILVSQFMYTPTAGDFPNQIYLSPDNTKIACAPTYDDGIVILDTQGKVLYSLPSIGGHKFNMDSQIAWMPDNTLIFSIGESIYRTNANFTQATLIKTLNFQSWSGMTASPNGKKIAFTGGNNIWMMNSDGSNLKQITQSDEKVKCGSFSPDSKELLIGTNWIGSVASFSQTCLLAIIPADGQTYNVNYAKGGKTVFIQNKNSYNDQQLCGGKMVWRK